MPEHKLADDARSPAASRSFPKLPRTDVTPGSIRPVAWYSPFVLLRSVLELSQSISFQRNFDRREFFRADLGVVDLSAHDEGEAPFAFDFISDTGDGGDATFAVASAAFADASSSIAALEGPESKLLVLGGDLAYPGASSNEYQRRLLEPFKAARALFPAPKEKVVLAIPQNHDWFDSASTFCRYFVNPSRDAFLGSTTPQTRTYFAALLPRRWWILGLDFAAAGDMDRIQFEAFSGLLATIPEHAADPHRIRRGDSVIVLVPRPYWTDDVTDQADNGYPRRHQRLEGMLERIGAAVRLRLAGDLHHYVRELAHDGAHGPTVRDSGAPSFDATTRVLVTCGAGGAFTHPTHTDEVEATKVLRVYEAPDGGLAELAAPIAVGRWCEAPETNPGQVAWPDRDTSLAMATRVATSLFGMRRRRGVATCGQRIADWFDSNHGLLVVLGVVYALVAYSFWTFKQARHLESKASVFVFKETSGEILAAICAQPIDALLVLFMVGSCIALGREGAASPLWKGLGGLLHGLAHLGGVFLAWWLSTSLVRAIAPTCFAGAHLAMAFDVVLGGVLGGLILGVYLAIACRGFGQMTNNAFGALADDGYKGFMRFRITDEGLHATMLGVDAVERGDGKTKPTFRGWKIVDEFTLTTERAADGVRSAPR